MRVYLITSKVTDSVIYGYLPAAGPQPEAEPGTGLTYWPLRHPGDRITLTPTDRDYLGVIGALGPAAVTRSIQAFRAAGRWDIAP